MEIYDTEEEQVAAIKRWWKENGAATMTGAVMGALLIGGWNFWQSYTKDKTTQASAMYEKLMKGAETNNVEEIQRLSESISVVHGSTAYSSYAALMLAKTKIKQGDLKSAKGIFEKQMKESNSVELRNIARIRLVRLLYSTGENEKGLQVISEADQSNIQGFSSSYDELKGDLYVELKRLGEARTAYDSALRSGNRSPLLQFKLDDISVSDTTTTTL